MSDLIGERFGNLIVIQDTIRGMLCECDYCKKLLIVSRSDLELGVKQNCGNPGCQLKLLLDKYGN